MSLITSVMIVSTIAQIAAPSAPPVPPTPPPPIVNTSAGPDGRSLVRWTRSPAMCAGEQGGSIAQAERVVLAVEPMRTLVWANASVSRTIALDFRIDASGRPLGITRVKAGYVGGEQDVMPAFAASRFTPGAARSHCTITFTGSAASIAAAPLADVMAYALFPSGPPDRAVWDRLQPAGSTCAQPAPEVLNRAFPAFRTLPDQPGYMSWSMTRYDIDRDGKPVRLVTVAGSGETALDRAALQAVAQSRFEPGARTGCQFPYWKGATILPAPLLPQEDDQRPAGSTCPRERDWDRKPVLRYPAAYRRRRIEGWAMIAYDVAPWGQTGNVTLVQAEPTAEFGDAAMAMLRAATLKPSKAGYIGCVERVRYVIGKSGMPPSTGQEPPDIILR